MTSQRNLRLDKELRSLLSNASFGIKCWCVDNNRTHLEAMIEGTDGSPYEGGSFKLDILIPERYPFEPPNIKFVTPVYHPNIDEAGRICLDLLKMPPKGGWSPTFNLMSVLTTILVLMNEPNLDDPLMTEISDQFKYKPQIFSKTAKEWTQKYAMSTQKTESNLTVFPEDSQLV